MTGPLHILALVTDAWGGRGGIAQYNRDLIAALVQGGGTGSLTVVPRSAPDVVDPPGGVRQVRARPNRIAYALEALRQAVLHRVDIVFCGHLYMAPLARLIARLKRARLVIQTHGIEAWRAPGGSLRSALEAADLVLAVSRYTRHAILGWASIAPERLIVLPNTVGDSFKPGDGGDLRAAWGLDGKRVLLTVGRMDRCERYKGHERIIAALTALPRDVVFVVVGDGDDRPRLEALANSMGVSDRVRFMGHQPEAVKLHAYRLADLFVMPSTGEGFGIVFLEAMACGTPALGLAVAGARDALADGELGIEASAEDLTAVIATALERREPLHGLLAANTQARFGREAFVNCVRLFEARLAEMRAA